MAWPPAAALATPSGLASTASSGEARFVAPLASRRVALRHAWRWRSALEAGATSRSPSLVAATFNVTRRCRSGGNTVRGMRGLRSRFDPETSFAIERVAMRAWPAVEVEEVEGWWLRRTEGVGRRRSNSLLPPLDSGHAVRTVDLALATAEALGFDEVVQVSPAEVHLRLDQALEDRGMTLGGQTLVLAGAVRGGEAPDVRLGGLSPDWVDAWAAVDGGDGVHATAELVLSQLGERARFARVDSPTGEPVAVGIGVVEEGWLGVFSLTVVEAARRRGLATAVMSALEAWAATAGARGVYLQVEADNDAALALYARRGMYVAHSYHYRSA